MNQIAPDLSSGAGRLSERAWTSARRVDRASHRIGAVAARRRRRVMAEGAAAVFAGSVMAFGWTAVGATDDRMNSRRQQLEREMARMSSPLAEFMRLERTDERARAAAAQARERARPLVELLALIEALSREAHAGVTVSRLRRSDEGTELRVRAADSAAYAAWAKRLGRIDGVESAETIEYQSIAALKGRAGGEAVHARVVLRWRGASSASPVRRAALGDREHAREGTR